MSEPEADNSDESETSLESALLPITVRNNIIWYRSALLLGVAGGMAALITHPIDVIRVQMQSQFEYISPRQVLRNILKYRGILGIYFGIFAGIQREFLYSIMRFAYYENARTRGRVDNFWRRIQYASISGLLGGFMSTPISKVTTRIRTDAANPPDVRYNYRHVFHGLRCLYREGGLRNFFYMAKTCALRGMLITVCQLLTYHQIKESFINENNRFCKHWQRSLFASAVVGGITTVIITPIDVIEQIGHNTKASDFRGEKSIMRHLSCLHGVRGFYRGLIPNFLRIPPLTIITFLIYEKLSLKYVDSSQNTQREIKKDEE